ncbi:MAG: linear amide C-N hydrolase [Coriobacteriia bacterium]|nr:linear amide C-N hydrolase [Coriobacteriia bacterium]
MCTRAVYLGPEETVITARTMDWVEDIRTNLWSLPRGMVRTGLAGPRSVNWTSRFGSVVATGYDAGTADGMNEAGLVTSLLYLTEAQYTPDDGARPLISISLWAQYVLDNFGSVAEAVSALEAEPFVVLAPAMPNGSSSTLHLALSDATGDSAILEYIDGALTIHHGREFQVMTNSPIYDEQLALNKYWESIGGLTWLPGTNRAADRFARASFYITAIPQTADVQLSLASVLGVIRNVSVPLGITTPGQPNISSTRWRSVADHKRRVYYFDSATSPNTFWVPLADLPLDEGDPVQRLRLGGERFYSGNAAGDFEATPPFEFVPATAQ